MFTVDEPSYDSWAYHKVGLAETLFSNVLVVLVDFPAFKVSRIFKVFLIQSFLRNQLLKIGTTPIPHLYYFTL